MVNVDIQNVHSTLSTGVGIVMIVNTVKRHLTLVVIVVATITIVFLTVICPIMNYNKAIALAEAGHYADAFVIFTNLGDYKDSIKQAEQIRTSHNEELLNLISEGNIVSFGKYEQDNNIFNGPEDIEWLVLARENNRILLLSRYALDCKAEGYSGDYTSWRNTWGKNKYRAWLNNTFIKVAFSNTERSCILTTTLHTKDSRNQDIKDNTRDKIFFLSVPEAEKYLIFDADRECKPTKYTKARGCYMPYKDKNNRYEHCQWWLRTPVANSKENFKVVNYDGSLDGGIMGTASLIYGSIGIRPALWLKIN